MIYQNLTLTLAATKRADAPRSRWAWRLPLAAFAYSAKDSWKMIYQSSPMMLERHRLAIRLTMLMFALVLSAFFAVPRAEAACTLPSQITNGQPADATVVMGNFNALKDCVNSAVSPSGATAAGSLPVFTGPNTIANGDLSGDCVTAGGLAVTCSKSNGVPFSHFATGTDAGQLTGTVSVNRFNNGLDANNSHFLRGDGVWAIPPGTGGGSATVPILVQSKLAIGNQPATDGVAFDAPVTPGNLIVVLATHFANAPIVGPGWFQMLNTNGAASGLIACMKVATDADVALLYPFVGGGSGQNLAMFEIRDAPPTPIIAIAQIQEQNTATPILKGAAVRDNSLIIGMISSELGNAAPTGMTGAAAIGELQGVASASSPRQITAFKRDSATKGAANVAITYPSSTVRYGLMVTIPPQ